ncbi:MAG: DUF3874 domain-containing protein [Prevotella sp.]|nr:DUF3874 domain-containing protein [Prevotella sp.]
MESVTNSKAPCANTMGTLCVESFLNENYRFRRNELSGKVELAEISKEPNANSQELNANSKEPCNEDFRPLSQEALNSIILRAMREEVVEKGSPKSAIELYVHSEEVTLFNPVTLFLNQLPQWDGQNHVARLFSRLPGLSSEQHAFLAVWLRSTVAHWLQMDTLHGNECVPVLIGAQGCGKTTFLRRLLPQELRQYYLDHLNLSNKFDKEMALTNNLLVNLDELEAIRPSQHASLKQALSKNKVNGRPIFGRAQEDRKRFASFVATTNNPHPLTDATGSRRYICLTIPKGQLIDNTGDIDYGQLYAQVLHELREMKAPYWFNNDEVARIQQLNQEYMEKKDLVQMVECCFRKPEEGEKAISLNPSQLLKIICKEYPSVSINHSTRIQLGLAMNELGFESYNHAHVSYYKAIPLKVA